MNTISNADIDNDDYLIFFARICSDLFLRDSTVFFLSFDLFSHFTASDY